MRIVVGFFRRALMTRLGCELGVSLKVLCSVVKFSVMSMRLLTTTLACNVCVACDNLFVGVTVRAEGLLTLTLLRGLGVVDGGLENVDFDFCMGLVGCNFSRLDMYVGEVPRYAYFV